MTKPTIRDLDPDVNVSLRDRATRNGRRMEENAHVFAESLATPPRSEPDSAEAIRRRFAPIGGIDLEPHPAVATSDPARFDRRSCSTRA